MSHLTSGIDTDVFNADPPKHTSLTIQVTTYLKYQQYVGAFPK